MKLQVALDFLELDEAMAITAEIANYVDIVEIGTPLIIHSGLEAVRRAKCLFPQKTILADLKIADAGAEESQMALDAGADVVTVLATASDNTIRSAAKAVHAVDKELLVDLIAAGDIYERASQLKELGADYLCLHTAFDDESSTERSYELLAKLKTLPGIKITVAGGINPDSIRQILSADPDVVIVGRGLTAVEDKAGAARQLSEAMAPACDDGKKPPLDLSNVAGLDISFDTETGHLVLGDDIVEVEPVAKMTEALKTVLLDPEGQGPEKMFYAYRGVMRKADLAMLQSHDLRHDIIVIPPGKVGKEYAKTTGHGHAMVPGSPHTFSEIYFVLHGTAHYLCQKVRHGDDGKPLVLDAFCIVAKAGDVVFIPPDYDHFTINATDGTLIVGNWAGTNYAQTYDTIAACRGASYYLVDEGGTLVAQPNDHYIVRGELAFCDPDYSLADGFKKGSRSYTTVVNNPQYFEYLAGRGRHRQLLEAWMRTRSYQAIAAEECPGAIAQTVLDELAVTTKGLKQDEYETFIKMLLGAKSIHLTGQGRSLLVAETFAMRLMHVGLSAHVVGSATAPSVGAGDVLIACSDSGTTAITIIQAESSQKAGADMVALTCKPDSPLGRLADLAVHIPAVEKSSQSASQQSIQLPGTLFEQALFIFFDSTIVTLRKVLNKSNADMMTLHSNVE